MDDLLSEIEPKARALLLSGEQGIADFVAHSVQNQAQVLAANDLNVLNRYRKGDVGAYFRINVIGTDHEFCLAFRRIPPATEGGFVASPERLLEIDGAGERNHGTDVQWDESQVFLGISNLIQCPEGVIPSFVSLVALKERADFRGQILARAGDIVPEIFFSRPKRKFDGLQSRALPSKSGGVTSLVENCAQVISSVEEDAGQRLRQLARELNFVDVLAGLTLFINDVGPWLFSDERGNNRFEIVDVMFCTLEGEPRASEQISHAQARPDKRP